MEQKKQKSVLLVFILFITGMLVSLSFGLSMIIPLLLGLALFIGLALKQGKNLKNLWRMICGSIHDSLLVVRILILVGCLTGLWRASGTIAYFVTVGIRIMPGSLFYLATFLLAAAMSFAFGTSFGVTATAGVILITIARTGGANTVLTSGAILSGVYVGDRGSPASSAGNLVAVLTHTDMRNNVKQMLKTSIVPFVLTCVIYLILSLKNPMSFMESDVLDQLAEEFRMGWICLAPALLMMILPFCGVKIKMSMAVSIAVSFLVCIFWQRMPVKDCVKALVLGFSPKNANLSSMLSGGGILSMLEVCGILIVSGAYGGIFKETGMLSDLDRRLKCFSEKTNRFTTMILLGAGVSAVFCNQTIGIMMENQLSTCLYGDTDEEHNRKMLDIENSVVTIAGLVPWCIACSVPLSMLGAGVSSVPLAFYLWMIPLWNWVVSLSGKRKGYSSNRGSH